MSDAEHVWKSRVNIGIEISIGPGSPTSRIARTGTLDTPPTGAMGTLALRHPRDRVGARPAR